MATATLMRTASGAVQPHVAHGNGILPLSGRSRTGGSLPSPRSRRLFGRERRGVAASSQRVLSEVTGYDGQVGSRARGPGTGKVAVEEQEGSMVLGREAVGFGVQPGACAPVPEFVEEAGGAGTGRGGGGGHGGCGGGGRKDGKEGTGAGGGRGEMGAYYRGMLEADPGNSLLLRNYGKFLHEVEGDVEGAEECYGRAILASPGDGEVLSLYGKLIWDAHRDEGRAEAYFERAVEASPDDCYVLGSYAHFLWDAEEEEEERPSSSSAATSSSSQQHHLLKAY